MYTWVEIDQKKLINNFNIFSNLIGKETLVPIIKSNAYGHGLKEVASILIAQSPKWLGTNYLFEAKIIRDLGFKGNILNVGPILEEDFESAVKLKTEIFIGNQELLEQWIQCKNKPTIHIKFDTGMARQGFLPEEAENVAKQCENFATNIAGVCTHFANVEDVLELEYANQQMNLFEKALTQFRKKPFSVLAHAASSASTLLSSRSRFDLSRVGISMFGQWPSKATRLSYSKLNNEVADLEPILSWRCKITTVKKIKKGNFIGYGCTFQASADMTIAVLPVGYYEGFPRIAGESQSYVLINGERCPVLGRICMNMMIVDVSHITDTKLGDVATLIGSDKDQTITADQFASWAQTIHYEALTCINGSIERRIIE